MCMNGLKEYYIYICMNGLKEYYIYLYEWIERVFFIAFTRTLDWIEDWTKRSRGIL